MIKNFFIPYNVGLTFDGKEYDLHNDFDMTRIEMNFESRSFAIRFQKGKRETDEASIILNFLLVESIFIFPRILSLTELTVVELGYKNPDDFDREWLISEAKSRPGDHFFIAFNDGDYIRVSCKSIVASLS